jgi:hypothetical protein
LKFLFRSAAGASAVSWRPWPARRRRAGLFSVSPASWHSDRLLNPPDGDTRKSINLYYFSERSPTRTDYFPITTFRARPGERKNAIRFPIGNALRRLYRTLRTDKD